jgi:hypothetical protein
VYNSRTKCRIQFHVSIGCDPELSQEAPFAFRDFGNRGFEMQGSRVLRLFKPRNRKSYSHQAASGFHLPGFHDIYIMLSFILNYMLSLMFYIRDIYLRKIHKAVQIVDLLLAGVMRTLILPMCFTAFQAPRIFINDICRGQSIRDFIFILRFVGLVPFLEFPFEWGPRCLGLGFFKSNDPVHHFFLILHDVVHGSL